MVGAAFRRDRLELVLDPRLVGRGGRHQALPAGGVGEDAGPEVVEDRRENWTSGGSDSGSPGSSPLGDLQRVPRGHAAGTVDHIGERSAVLAGAEELGAGPDAPADAAAGAPARRRRRPSPEPGSGPGPSSGGRAGRAGRPRRASARRWAGSREQGVGRRVGPRPAAIGTGGGGQERHVPQPADLARGAAPLARALPPSPVVDRLHLAPEGVGPSAAFGIATPSTVSDATAQAPRGRQGRAPQGSRVGHRRLAEGKMRPARAGSPPALGSVSAAGSSTRSRHRRAPGGANSGAGIPVIIPVRLRPGT